MCRLSQVWTAGGGVDKTPCLWWGRGRGERTERQKHWREELGGKRRQERGQEWGVEGAVDSRGEEEGRPPYLSPPSL